MKQSKLLGLFGFGSLVWQVGASCSVTLLLILTLTPGGIQTINIPHIDKLYHFLAFFGVTFLVRVGFFSWPILNNILALILLGFLIEIIQHFIPNREFSWLDLVADIIGILSVHLLFFIFKSRIPVN